MYNSNNTKAIERELDEYLMDDSYSTLVSGGSRSGFNRDPEGFMMPATLVVSVLSLVLALVIFFGFVIRKKDPKSSIARWWKEFLNFRKIWIAGLMKFCYLFAALFTIFGGIAIIIYGFYEGREQGVMLLVGLGTIVFGTIGERLIYEFFMILVGLWENTADIRGVLVGAKQRVEDKKAALAERGETKAEVKVEKTVEPESKPEPKPEEHSEE